MAEMLRWIGQAAVYAGMALWLGYFANRPVYTHLPPDQALIKLSVVHGAQRRGECRSPSRSCSTAQCSTMSR
jgi:hypothetical protein